MPDLRTAANVEQALAILEERIAAVDRKKRPVNEVFSMTAAADSATWNSSTKVITNLLGSFTAVKGITYRAHAEFCWTCAAPNHDAFGVAWNQGGAATISSPIPTPKTSYCPVATGFVLSKVSSKFTATADGTIGVALLGWKPTGDTNVSRLKGAAGYMVNELWVEIVG